MYRNNLISLAKFGFRENSNTEMAICTLTNPTLETLERRNRQDILLSKFGNIQYQ
jgi:hypothetical protein